MSRLGLLPILAVSLLLPAASLSAQECCDPEGPFTMGEDFPKTPANCDTIKHWAARAPDTTARTSLAISGQLAAVTFDGTLAFLTMCDARSVQVMCVTYSTNNMRAGDAVTFAGGYNRAGENRIVLDPCLASRQ